MPDIKKVIEKTNTNDPQQIDRELDLQEWDQSTAEKLAEKEGIKLNEDHLKVIYFLRRQYLIHGPGKTGRAISEMLNKRFAEYGGRKYLYQLFPDGPVAQGMKIAGLDVPPHTENESAGVNL